MAGLDADSEWRYVEDVGYWWSDKVGMYYDHRTRYYGSDGEWFQYNEETGEYDLVVEE